MDVNDVLRTTSILPVSPDPLVLFSTDHPLTALSMLQSKYIQQFNRFSYCHSVTLNFNDP